MAEYQSNSNRSKELAKEQASGEKREIKKVVSGKVKTRENKGRKFADIFISEDAGNIGSHIVMDVLVQVIKDTIFKVGRDSLEMLLFGRSGGGSSSNRSSDRISYRKYYDDNRRDDRSRSGSSSSGRFTYQDIVFDSRRDAEAVRDQMLDAIDRYNMVTVFDMYDMADLNPPYTSDKDGWYGLRGIDVVRDRDGWILKLPKAMPID